MLSLLLRSTYGAGASSACPESVWHRVLNHSNYKAGDWPSVGPHEMVPSCPSLKDFRVGVLNLLWPVISNLSHFIYQNIFSPHFFIQHLLTDGRSQAAKLDYEKCPFLHPSCVQAVCLSVTYQGAMRAKTSGQ